MVFQQLRKGRILVSDAQLRTWQTDLCQTGAERQLAGDEGRPSGGAAVFSVKIGEHGAFRRDLVDVRRLVTHHAAVIDAEVTPA